MIRTLVVLVREQWISVEENCRLELTYYDLKISLIKNSGLGSTVVQGSRLVVRS